MSDAASDALFASRTIDLDGRRLALVEAGEGSPCIFLETGLGAESSQWDAVQRGIARFTRVARYDRAGRGASARATMPRTAGDALADLHALLHTPGLRDGPCVLIGHSFGGLLVRLYAQQHARDVAALVLVEAMHEAQFERLGPLFPEAAQGDAPTLCAMRAFWRGRWRDPSNNPEHIDLVQSFEQLRAAPALPAGIPLTLLSAGGFLDAKLFPHAAGEPLQAAWLELQGELAALSRPLEHVFVQDSGHFMQRDRPQAIVAAVESLVARLRAPARNGVG
jgi:pimeloyl-ACP methyl ester carboxylesterase